MIQVNNNMKSTETPINTGKTRQPLDRTFCTAPMMDWSDRHCRYFWRTMTKRSVLYTEMVTTGALIHGGKERFLKSHAVEYPVALQLGGSNPEELARCSEFAQEFGFDEVNLNVGCPSDRVQNNRIGACLMDSPTLVADCLQEMAGAVDIPVTIKHRIGIDELDSYDYLKSFVEIIANRGVNVFIIHARIAILDGLSPKENREIPPLKYEWVYKLKEDFPELEIIINGGIKTHKECDEHLQYVDGVMLGREAYQNPGILIPVDHLYYGERMFTDDKVHRINILKSLIPYIAEQIDAGSNVSHIVRHTLGLFNGMPGARQFRRYLSEHMHREPKNIEVLVKALNQLM